MAEHYEVLGLAAQIVSWADAELTTLSPRISYQG